MYPHRLHNINYISYLLKRGNGEEVYIKGKKIQDRSEINSISDFNDGDFHFVKRKHETNKNNKIRKNSSGFSWKQNGSETKIKSGDITIGYKRTLTLQDSNKDFKLWEFTLANHQGEEVKDLMLRHFLKDSESNDQKKTYPDPDDNIIITSAEEILRTTGRYNNTVPPLYNSYYGTTNNSNNSNSNSNNNNCSNSLAPPPSYLNLPQPAYVGYNNYPSHGNGTGHYYQQPPSTPHSFIEYHPQSSPSYSNHRSEQMPSSYAYYHNKLGDTQHHHGSPQLQLSYPQYMRGSQQQSMSSDLVVYKGETPTPPIPNTSSFSHHFIPYHHVSNHNNHNTNNSNNNNHNNNHSSSLSSSYGEHPQSYQQSIGYNSQQENHSSISSSRSNSGGGYSYPPLYMQPGSSNQYQIKEEMNSSATSSPPPPISLSVNISNNNSNSNTNNNNNTSSRHYVNNSSSPNSSPIFNNSHSPSLSGNTYTSYQSKLLNGTFSSSPGPTLGLSLQNQFIPSITIGNNPSGTSIYSSSPSSPKQHSTYPSRYINNANTHYFISSNNNNNILKKQKMVGGYEDYIPYHTQHSPLSQPQYTFSSQHGKRSPSGSPNTYSSSSNGNNTSNLSNLSIEEHDDDNDPDEIEQHHSNFQSKMNELSPPPELRDIMTATIATSRGMKRKDYDDH